MRSNTLDPTLIDQVKSLLNDKNLPIGIVAHTNPDGDAIGSSLGMFEYLKKKGFERVFVITPNEYPSFLQWMPNNEKVTVATKAPELAKKLISEAKVLFCLDFNGLSRTNGLEKPIAGSAAKKIMIDHHPQPEEGFDIVISDVLASSTSELVYEFIEGMGDEKIINLEMAECLLAGIVTDTGSFSYSCNQPKTYRIAAKLVETGVDAQKIHRLIYNTYSADRLRLLGYCLSEKLVVFPKHQAAYISLTQDELDRFNHQEGDTEGIVNYALSIENIMLAALFIEKSDHVKISFRSENNWNVNLLAREYFNGGGHKNAAGGKSFESLKDTLLHFESLVKKEVISTLSKDDAH